MKTPSSQKNSSLNQPLFSRKIISRITRIVFWIVLISMLATVIVSTLFKSQGGTGSPPPTELDQAIEVAVALTITQVASQWTSTPTPNIEDTVSARVTSALIELTTTPTLVSPDVFSTPANAPTLISEQTPAPTVSESQPEESNDGFIEGFIGIVESIIRFIWSVVTSLWNFVGSFGIAFQICCCIIPAGMLAFLLISSINES